MKKIQLTILLLITLIINVKSQEKNILGDTSFFYKGHKNLIEKLELTDFYTSQNDFNFRFQNHGQFVEISKDNDSIHGNITNYIFKLRPRDYEWKDTIINKIDLSEAEASIALDIINNSGILDIPSMYKVEEWKSGFDGIIYFVEYSNKNEYWYKSYWTPSLQDSIPESLVVLDFVKKISDTLNLSDRYADFKKALPYRGCYHSGGISVMCYVSNSFGLGYIGSTKLPFGYFAHLYLAYIGKAKSDFGISFQHRFDRLNNKDFELKFGRGNLFFRKYQISDYISYSYRNRQLDFIDSDISFQNHKVTYGLSFKNNISLGIGIDNLKDSNQSTGGIIYASKWFSKPQINLYANTSIFKTEIDYLLGISKSFSINRRFIIKGASIGLTFENFRDFNDLSIALKLWI